MMEKLKTLTLSSVLTVLAASCDVSQAAAAQRPQAISSRTAVVSNMQVKKELPENKDSLTVQIFGPKE